MELLAGSDVVNALSLLRDASIAAGNVRGSLRFGVDALNAYREWAVRYARTLRSVFDAPMVDELILSPGYARLDRLDPRAYGPGLLDVVSLELDRAIGALDTAHEELEQKKLT